MIDKKLLAQHGLKWNPFSLQLPLEALQRSGPIDGFCRRVENLAREGGFALLTGETGTGKSSAMRLLASHLGTVCDLRVGELTRPQSHMADFYRELGEIFGVESHSLPTTAGREPSSSASAGTLTSAPSSSARSCSLTRPRRCCPPSSTNCGS